MEKLTEDIRDHISAWYRQVSWKSPEKNVSFLESVDKQITDLKSKLKSAEEKIYLMEKGESLVDGWIYIKKVKDYPPENELVILSDESKCRTIFLGYWVHAGHRVWYDENHNCLYGVRPVKWHKVPKPSNDKFGPNSCSESVQAENKESE